MNQTAIGIDIGATYTKFGIMRRSGELVASERIHTEGEFHAYLDELAKKIKDMIKETGEDVTYAGIGCPNGNFYTGNIENAVNLPWKGIVPIVRELSGRLGMKVKMSNDANAAAIGEMLYGAATGMKDFITITLGTGLGSGIVSNGKLIRGRHGMAGELGHTMVKPGGRLCGCGKYGCLETYVSSPGIVRTAMEFMAKYKDESPLRHISFHEITPEKVADLARKGDSLALSVFNYSGEILGAKLADAALHTDPEAIFIFGGLTEEGPLIFEPTQKSFNENLQESLKGKIPLLQSKFSGVTGAVAGACALVFMDD